MTPEFVHNFQKGFVLQFSEKKTILTKKRSNHNIT